ncbi:hypothetical protein, partial [Shigella flexneri]|uniref:hypothetical protein n=1 Tax=Shigella flexneri TaxID=623 RepID=UPI001C0A7DEA
NSASQPSFFFRHHSDKHNTHTHTTKQNQNIKLTITVKRKTQNIEVDCHQDSAYDACDQHIPFFAGIPKMQNKQS